jgi:DNA-damage-inducible protein J
MVGTPSRKITLIGSIVPRASDGTIQKRSDGAWSPLKPAGASKEYPVNQWSVRKGLNLLHAERSNCAIAFTFLSLLSRSSGNWGMLRCGQNARDSLNCVRVRLAQIISHIINRLFIAAIPNVATMCSMKQSVVRARIDNDLKAEASAVLESCGLGLSDAVRIFLGQVVKQGGLPFPVRARHVVSGDQLRKMKRASQQRDRKLAANEDVSAGEMLLISPERMRNAQIAWPVVE